MLRRFLPDRARALQDEIVQRWVGKRLNLVDEQEARGRVIELTELAELKFEAIQAFYGVAPTEAKP